MRSRGRGSDLSPSGEGRSLRVSDLHIVELVNCHREARRKDSREPSEMSTTVSTKTTNAESCSPSDNFGEERGRGSGGYVVASKPALPRNVE